MAFDIGSAVAHIKADTTDFQAGIASAQTGLASFKDKISNMGQSMQMFGAKMTLFTAPLTLFFKSASEEAINLETNLTTLDIIAGRFGVSGEQAKKSAQELGNELRIGVSASAAGLQNLLKGGLSLDQATDLMRRFTNEAMTGKSTSLSLAQAVENLSFAYATNNSAIGNLSGINENFEDITQRGRQALIDEGVAVNTITDEMAKYRGMIDLTNLTMGSAERFHGTMIDKQAIMGQSVIALKVAFGQFINEALVPVINWLTIAFNWLNSLDENQQRLIVTIGLLVIATGPLITIFGVLTSTVSVLIGIATTLGTVFMFLATTPIGWLVLAIAGIIAIGLLLIKHWDDVKKFATNMVNWIFSAWDGLKNRISAIGGQIIDSLVSPFQSAWNRIQDLVNKIKDALDFTKRHSPSVVDIVTMGVKKVNSAMENLDFGSGLMVKPSLAMAGGVQSSTINQFNVSMDGAIIANEASAMEFGEIIGDSMIRKLQQTMRV